MTTKFKTIETEEYVLAISDEEVKLSNDNIGFFLRTHSISTNIDIIQNPSFTSKYKYEKVIAYKPKGNAPELDLPLLPDVEEDVEKLPYDKLCYYDRRNPDFQIKEEYGYDKEEVKATGEFSKKDCSCDNCFYGRAKLADRIIKSATKKYSEEDLRKAINMARGIKEGKETFTAEDISGSTEVCTYGWKFEFDEDEIIQSLKQPKWFVAEMKHTKSEVFRENDNVPYAVLKTTTINNKTYLVGTYLN
jgi:hypothetical protein